MRRVQEGLGQGSEASTADVAINGQPIKIGSGPKCDLRIDSPGVMPLHCVVSAEGTRVVARRWAPNAWINDEEFQEAELQSGDSLRVGQVTFEVLSTPDLDDPIADSLWSDPVEEALESAEEDDADDVFEAAELPGPEPIHDEVDSKKLATGGEAEVDVAEQPVVEEAPITHPLLSDERPGGTPAHAAVDWDYESRPEVACIAAEEAPIAGEAETEEVAPTSNEAAWRRRYDVARNRARALIDALRRERIEWVSERAELVERIEADQATLETLVGQLEQRLAESEAAEAEIAHLDQLAKLSADKADEALAELAETRLTVAKLSEQIAALEAAVETARQEQPPATVEPTLADEDAAAASSLWESDEQIEADSADAAVSKEPDWLNGAADISEEEDETNEAVGEVLAVAPEVAEASAIGPPVAEEPAAAVDDLWAVERMAQEPDANANGHMLLEEVDADSATLADESDAADLEEPVAEAADGWLEGSIDNAPSDADEVDTYAPTPLADETPANDDSNVPAEPSTAEADWAHDARIANATTAFDPPSEEPSDEPRQPHEPESFIDKYAHLIPNDSDPAESVAPPAAEPVAATPQPELQPEPQAAASATGDEESLDDYMQRMMQRLRGEDTTAAPRASQPTIQDAATPQPTSLAAPVAEKPIAPVIDIEELRGGPAPEKGRDMNALRQLANQSAREAIDTSVVNQNKEHATLRLVFGVTSIAGGAVCCLVAPGLASGGMLVGVAATLTGVYFLYRTYNAAPDSSDRSEAIVDESQGDAVLAPVADETTLP